MGDASLKISSRESITVGVPSHHLSVFVWCNDDGEVRISVNKGCDRDDIQVVYREGNLHSITSPAGEKVALAVS